MKKMLVFISLLLATSAAQCMSPLELAAKRKDLNEQLMNVINDSLSFNLETDKYNIKNLLRDGAEIGYVSSKGQTPLEAAIHRNNLELAKFLIENHADVNREDDLRMTPLIYATYFDNKYFIKYLLGVPEIDVNKIFKHKEYENQAYKNQTALDIAYEKPNWSKPESYIEKSLNEKRNDIIQMLLAAGAKTYKELLQESEQKS